jgi:hypothetical protein
LTKAFRARASEAEGPPRAKSLRVSLPSDLRSVTLRDLPANVSLTFGKLEIRAESAIAMLECPSLLAQAMQNDPEQINTIFDHPPPPPVIEDDDLKQLLASLRSRETR